MGAENRNTDRVSQHYNRITCSRWFRAYPKVQESADEPHRWPCVVFPADRPDDFDSALWVVEVTNEKLTTEEWNERFREAGVKI